MKNFNILGVHGKIRFSREGGRVTKSQYLGGGGGDLRGRGLARKRGMVFLREG